MELRPALVHRDATANPPVKARYQKEGFGALWMYVLSTFAAGVLAGLFHHFNNKMLIKLQESNDFSLKMERMDDGTGLSQRYSSTTEK